MAAFLIFSVCLSADEALIEAKLRFLVWRDQVNGGLLIDSSQVQRREAVDELVHLLLGEERVEVRLSSLRCSSSIEYRGDGTVSLLRQAGETVQFKLPANGDYYVLLRPKEGSYVIFSVETSRMREGEILIVNHSQYRCALKEAAGERLLISAGKSSLLKREDAAEHSCHFTLHCWREGKWRPVSSRYYSLDPRSKSLCVLYCDEGSRRLRLRFFSGL
ncbi:hypothetical protein ACFPK9_12085 [Rubritalea spongiae]|uniref:FecR protein domain-containing protein n=1 Tax=Rubritalea spongiae TaxID=430797 RepID=A0ABW5E0I5_9BACT